MKKVKYQKVVEYAIDSSLTKADFVKDPTKFVLYEKKGVIYAGKRITIWTFLVRKVFSKLPFTGNYSLSHVKTTLEKILGKLSDADLIAINKVISHRNTKLNKKIKAKKINEISLLIKKVSSAAKSVIQSDSTSTLQSSSKNSVSQSIEPSQINQKENEEGSFKSDNKENISKTTNVKTSSSPIKTSSKTSSKKIENSPFLSSDANDKSSSIDENGLYNRTKKDQELITKAIKDVVKSSLICAQESSSETHYNIEEIQKRIMSNYPEYKFYNEKNDTIEKRYVMTSDDFKAIFLRVFISIFLNDLRNLEKYESLPDSPNAEDMVKVLQQALKKNYAFDVSIKDLSDVYKSIYKSSQFLKLHSDEYLFLLKSVEDHLDPYLKGEISEHTEDKNRPPLVDILYPKFKKRFPESDLSKSDFQHKILAHYVLIGAKSFAVYYFSLYKSVPVKALISNFAEDTSLHLYNDQTDPNRKLLYKVGDLSPLEFFTKMVKHGFGIDFKGFHADDKIEKLCMTSLDLLYRKHNEEST